ncbi:MAG: TetR/AcrR family transcriptional regulator [Erythrobacter sp.]
MTKKIMPKRGRPRKFDPDRATEVAQNLFHAYGYDNVGVVRLAKDIGIEQPSLYAAFGNKLGLFKAVVERYAHGDGAFIPAAFAGAQTVTEGLKRMLEAAADLYSRDNGRAGCLIMEGAHGAHDEGARSLCAEKRAATEAFISGYVETRHPGRGEDVAAMTMIALAGLSASARAGMTGEQLLKFSHIAADALRSLIETNVAKPAREIKP